jgi:hypothetical protein
MDEQIRKEVKGPHTFVRDVLREIDREDVLVELDEENLNAWCES